MLRLFVIGLIGCAPKDDPTKPEGPSPIDTADIETDTNTNTDTDTDTDTNEPQYTSVNEVSPGDFVITELLKNPTQVSGDVGEWFEIYNTLNEPIDLNGMRVYDLGDDEFVVEREAIIEPRSYFVFGASADLNDNGGVPVDYAYNRSSMSLGNGEDELAIANSGGVIDIMIYDNGVQYHDEDGKSLSLDQSALDSTANDDPTNWCEAQISYGAGDFGTPGNSNGSCPVIPDNDSDGFNVENDCDDADPNVYPGADDSTCDGLDNDCDDVIDDDWNQDATEPNQTSEQALFLGNLGSGSNEQSVLTQTAYLFDDSDIDAFYFYTVDGWTDGGFEVDLDDVPLGVDIAFAVDFIPEMDDGTGTMVPDWPNSATDVRIEDSNGIGESESGCVGEPGLCMTTGYSTGFYAVRVYSMLGSDCTVMYKLTITD